MGIETCVLLESTDDKADVGKSKEIGSIEVVPVLNLLSITFTAPPIPGGQKLSSHLMTYYIHPTSVEN